MAAMCAVRGVIWRGTANPKVTAGNPVLEAVGQTKQVGQEQRSKEHFARECKQGRTGFFSCCAATSMKGDGLIVDT